MKKISRTATAFAILVSMFLLMIAPIRVQANYWSEPQQLTTDLADEYYASIMQDSSGKIWVVYFREGSLWCQTSLDDGVSWSIPHILVPNLLVGGGTSLLQDSAGRIWVAWASGQYSPYVDWDIFYIVSDDAGLSWSSPAQLTDYPGDDNIPSLIEVSGEVWIVFRSYGLSHNEDIWYMKTNDGGDTWSNPIQLTFGSIGDFSPDAMVDLAGNVWVVWGGHEFGLQGDIFYITFNGISWSTPETVTSHPAHEEHPTIIQDISGKIFVFWGIGTPRDVWYRTTVDGGETWSDYEMLTADTFNDAVPCATLVNNEVWVIWHSDRSGNSDIWMSKIVPVPATVDIDPDTLNLQSKGEWITTYITLPEGYNVEDIVPETVELRGISAAWSDIQDGVYMAKFNKTEVKAVLNVGAVTLTITGKANDVPFEGSDAIRVIDE